MTATPAIVTFYRMIPEAPLPQRADRSALGSLPTRAYRYCDAVTAAAGFGWHIAPPIDFDLLWDGGQVWWHTAGLPDWLPLGAAQFPHFAERFRAAAPEGIGDYAPPFLTALQEPGVVQVWTGLAARTAPGWSLLLRDLANLPRAPGHEAYEGILEADRWFGPLFTNLRLTRTDTPIAFRAGEPFLQVQPVPQAAYADAVLNGAAMVGGLEAFSAQDWAGYHDAIVVPNRDRDTPPGRYAIEGRRRRKSGGCPFAAAMALGAAPAG
ncbi:DUF6065 family protein [Paracraurococcus lichenis]|uniref:DUF6065 family protein n=1 Tax=Paracraurococcus lichenis TaxID=3064888 RepID=A0ABT9DVQ3_9PROT|nr:DUF6065 family protein [Paracraurococcus sp. LOR1-02]MDO9707972.1 DUF6065 family protein [Paracraurococcus sp. LOR1-02]